MTTNFALKFDLHPGKTVPEGRVANKKKRRSHESSTMAGEPPDPEAVLEDKAVLSVSTIETSDDAIITKTSKGVIACWNRSVERIYGFSAQEILGKPISILTPPGKKDEVPEVLERMKQGESINPYEAARKRKDGQFIHVSVSISPIMELHWRSNPVGKVCANYPSTKSLHNFFMVPDL